MLLPTNRRLFSILQPIAFCGLLALAVARDEGSGGTLLGAGEHVYRWVPDWAASPGGLPLGSTHGALAVTPDGRIFASTDSERAVLELSAAGELEQAFGAELGAGVHGLAVGGAPGAEVLYLAHTGLHEVRATTLAGEALWTVGWPEESKLYATPDEYRPTAVAVAPDGRFWVADGYGKHYVHEYDAERRWVRAFGGPGSEPGQFNTPHGILFDTRGSAPRLVVADRENHRLQIFDLAGVLLDVVEGFRRPCGAAQLGDELVVADLAGRVTILDSANEVVLHLGDQPDLELRANFGAARGTWRDGEFLAPHSAVWDGAGNLYVLDWSRTGRLSKLERVR